MKRILAFVLAVAASLAILAGCSKKKAPPGPENQQQMQQEMQKGMQEQMKKMKSSGDQG